MTGGRSAAPLRHRLGDLVPGGPPIAVAAGGTLVFTLLTAALVSRGISPAVPALALAALVLGAALLADARAALLAAVGAIVLAESSPDWAIGFPARLYQAYGPLSAADLLLLLAVAAMVLDARRREAPLRLPVGMVAPLLLAAGAALFGVLNGYLGGRGEMFAVVTFVEALAPLFVVPILVVNVIRSPQELRRALGIGGALAVVKAVLGLVVVGAGLGEVLYEGGARLTYYEPASNLLVMLTLLALAGAALARAPSPRWLVWATPLLLACLILSYRRTFWIATMLCLILVAVVASGRVGRRLAVPVTAVVIAIAALLAQSGVASGLQGPVVQRATSLTPSKVKRNEQDRYRLAERRNVVAALRRQPVTGLGVGVAWPARYPMTFEYPFGRQYVHAAILWWWMKMGVLGAVAYLWLIVGAVASGLVVWRRHRDPSIRIFGLAAGIGVIGIAVAEAAATIIGADHRGTVLFGVVIGLLSVARREAADAPASVAAGETATLRAS